MTTDTTRTVRLLKRHHRFTNRSVVRCFCGAILGDGTYLDAPAVGMWAEHVAAVLMERGEML